MLLSPYHLPSYQLFVKWRNKRRLSWLMNNSRVVDIAGDGCGGGVSSKSSVNRGGSDLMATEEG